MRAGCVQRVTQALNSCTPLEARLDPEWRLAVTEADDGRMAVSVRRAADAEEARNASRRGTKGVTLRPDEWLSLTKVLPKIKTCLVSMKGRRRKKE